MEVVKFQQAFLINSDLDMYYPLTDTPALCRTSSLVEELGQIEYVFSDKTGTLTCNEMEFQQCSIAGIPYIDVVEEGKRGELFSFAEMRATLTGGHETSSIIHEFLTLLATCHTVIPEKAADGKITYQASSPDEAALVSGADQLGYTFTVSFLLLWSFCYSVNDLRSLLTSFRHGNRVQSSSIFLESRQNIKFLTSLNSIVLEKGCLRLLEVQMGKSSFTAKALTLSFLSV